MLNDSFSFFVPANIIKGRADSGDMIMEGIASTGDIDREGESNLAPEGLDYKFLRDYGHINYHHIDEPMFKTIGKPIEVRMKPQGLYIKGRLYAKNKIARQAYAEAQMLEEEGDPNRQMGWSVEGQVIERDKDNENKITKARITAVALTPMPVNANTYARIVKAFTNKAEAGDLKSGANGGKTAMLDITVHTPSRIKYFDNGECRIEKCMDTESGASLKKEDGDDNDKPKGAISKGMAIRHILERYRDIDYVTASNIYDRITG